MIRATAIAAGLVVALAAALAGTIKIEEGRVAAARQRAAAAALGRLNVEAERDSTHDVALEKARAAALLGDSLRMVEKRVIQVTQRAVALDRALGTERKASYTIYVAADSLGRRVDAPALLDSADDLRRATFDVAQAPYRVQADVEIPRPPKPARMSVGVTMEAIPIRARVTCGATDQYGARSAAIDVVTPKWATAKLGDVSQAPDVCAAARSPANTSLVSFKRLLVGAGLIGTPRQWGVGAFVGAGLTFGR